MGSSCVPALVALLQGDPDLKRVTRDELLFLQVALHLTVAWCKDGISVISDSTSVAHETRGDIEAEHDNSQSSCCFQGVLCR